MAPVTADLSQDHELRRLVRVWEEARDKEVKEIKEIKESDLIPQLPDPVPVKVSETPVKVQETELSSVQESRSQPESERAPSVKSDFVELSNNAESDINEDDITFEGITFSDRQNSVTSVEVLDDNDTQNVAQEVKEKTEEVPVEKDIPFSEKTEQQLIEETISTLTGDEQKPREKEKSPNVALEKEDQEDADEAISSETIALIFDEQPSVKEPVKETQKTPVKINLKFGFQKLSGQVNVPVITSREEQDLEVFEDLRSSPEPTSLIPTQKTKSSPES